ncbi:unnamed protein product [Bursaphelenchus okinawaensis]|uniref:Uncharacterized protein n=1 Tax=Bursaphelenchus okinawaensis TaxID=465554 RepID=A0A811K645_9BILA|nr:unnamed protein product [Bursaphelenchus okinawaensis]CAG9092167.1 unnamed protein product [Bursaphelenchus okinawaensis]
MAADTQHSQYLDQNQQNRSVYLDRSTSTGSPFTPTPHSSYFTGAPQNPSIYAHERNSFFNSRRSWKQNRHEKAQSSGSMETALEPQPGDKLPVSAVKPQEPTVAVESSSKSTNPLGWFGFKHLFSEYCYNKPEAVNLGRVPIRKQEQVVITSAEDSGDTSGEDSGSGLGGNTEKTFVPVKPEVSGKPSQFSSRYVTQRPKSDGTISECSFGESTNKSIVLPDGSVATPQPKNSPIGSLGQKTETELNSLKLDYESKVHHDFIKPSHEYFAGRENALPVHSPRSSKLFAQDSSTSNANTEPKASMWKKLFNVWSQSSYGSNK